jgi:hypothetical protein
MGPRDFGWAIRQLKVGANVAREGWNGRGMWLFLEQCPGVYPPGELGTRFTQDQIRPCICMRDAQGMIVPGWLASQTDMLAEDWELVP